jgi:hypothetical protein
MLVLVSCRYRVWGLHSWANLGDRRADTRIRWITGSLYAIPHGRGFVTEPRCATSLQIFLWFLWRISVFSGWGLIV